jgi:hypothetical protein
MGESAARKYRRRETAGLILVNRTYQESKLVSRTAECAHAHGASADFHSTIIRSAHSTSETKIAGLPNFAPH